MIIAVYLPLVAAVLFGAIGPRLAVRALPPIVGAWTLTVGTGLIAAASAWSLVLLAGTLIDDVDPIGHHQIGVIQDPSQVNDLVGLAAAVLLVTGCVRVVAVLVRRHGTHRRLRALCDGTHGDLVVLADPTPQAFALPGHGGRIVVSSGMLAALSAAERRVLLAHERAHLSAGHHWHTGLGQAAAAFNPALRPVRAATGFLCERWADESAATEVGDRTLAATSLARAALAAHDRPPATRVGPDQHENGLGYPGNGLGYPGNGLGHPGNGLGHPGNGLGYHETGVGDRVAALQRPPGRRRPLGCLVLALGLLGLGIGGLAADVHATADFLHFVAPFLPL